MVPSSKWRLDTNIDDTTSAIFWATRCYTTLFSPQNDRNDRSRYVVANVVHTLGSIGEVFKKKLTSFFNFWCTPPILEKVNVFSDTIPYLGNFWKTNISQCLFPIFMDYGWYDIGYTSFWSWAKMNVKWQDFRPCQNWIQHWTGIRPGLPRWTVWLTACENQLD